MRIVFSIIQGGGGAIIETFKPWQMQNSSPPPEKLYKGILSFVWGFKICPEIKNIAKIHETVNKCR